MTALAGTGNQLRREVRRRVGGARWVRQSLVWTVVLAGLLVVMVWVLPAVLAGEGGEATGTDLVVTAAQWVELAAVVLAVGVTILTHGTLLDDRRSGVLEWVLSKPLSRTGLVVAQFLASVWGILVTAFLLPWVVVWVILSVAHGGLWPVVRTAGALGAVALLVVFQVALVLALSVFTWSRGVALGVPLAALVGSDLVTAAVPWLGSVNPYLLGRAGGALMHGVGFEAVGPAVWAAVLTVLLVAAAAVRLERLEF